jgi:hypothetical protein
VPFISISAPSIVSGMSGESEKTLRDTFEEAKVGCRSIVGQYLLTPHCAACRTMPFVHRRNRRHHPETGERTERDGAADRGSILDVHGWSVSSRLMSSGMYG